MGSLVKPPVGLTSFKGRAALTIRWYPEPGECGHNKTGETRPGSTREVVQVVRKVVNIRQREMPKPMRAFGWCKCAERE